MPTVFFQTFGCQMNVADSDALLQSLSLRGYASVNDAGEADLIVVNTCSVRERAEARARARIAEFAAIKRRRPGARLWVIGCMAERLGDELRREIPGIDAVIGAKSLEDADAAVAGQLGKKESYEQPPAVAPGVSEFVPIMRGCDNYCTYCIVPYVRGPEQSIGAAKLVEEVARRAAHGVREVTLLGQNVNSYRDGDVDFPELLARVAEVKGIERIRFTTSHPKDCSEALVRAIVATPKLCRHIHLPVQSGSDAVLAAMNRRYTAAHYRSLVAAIRNHLPDVDLTTDLLVGFPSESDADFEETLSLVNEVGFTAAFMFAYSPREGTAAASFEDTVPHALKIERLNRLIALQTAITKKTYAAMVGREFEVMVYGRVEKKEGRFFRGQDNGCKRVLVACSDVPAGTILKVHAVRSSGMTLIAERI
jgi:tRNA-2-methylthio-N6-dimethylallyladenosine synthase